MGRLEERTGLMEHRRRDQPARERGRPAARVEIGALFDEEKDAIALIKWKEVLNLLERRPTAARTAPTCSKASSSSTRSVCLTIAVSSSSSLILLALVFDFINGFHDAANSIATVVSTRVLSPGQAVIWAAFFNFVAAFVFGTAVAKTVGSGMVDISLVTFAVIGAGLTGAIVWNLITWYFGLPTSSSHALFGGYAGAAVAKAGFAAIIWSGWIKTLIFIVVVAAWSA